MTTTVVALYDDMQHASQAVKDLVDHGFERENIGLVASDTKGEYKQHIEGGDDIIADTGKGAGIGAILGGIAGLVVGLGALAIPGVGPIIAAGPIASALAGAGIGAAGGGLAGALTNLGIPDEAATTYAEGVRQGRTLVTAQVPNERVQESLSILNHYDPIDTRQRGGQTQGMLTNREQTTQDRSQANMGTLPVIEEDVTVGKREVDKGGVRVNKTVTERPVEEDVTLRDERVNVERRPVDRPATDADFDKAFKEESFEIRETTEEPFVHKESRVVEEVDINKEVNERQQTIRDTERRTDVNVERTGSTTGYDEFEPLLRNHFQSTYSNTDYSYNDYAPAYRYGYDMYSNNRYQGRNWNDIETDVRQDWEHRYPNRMWEDFKDAIRQGWMVATGR